MNDNLPDLVQQVDPSPYITASWVLSAISLALILAWAMLPWLENRKVNKRND